MASEIGKARAKSREAAFRAAFAVASAGMDPDSALSFASEETNLDEKALEWAKALVRAIAFESETLDERFVGALVPGWPLERLGVIDRTALRLACHELWHCADVPPKATISQYVALAAKYGSPESGKFVNGVLAAVLPGSPKADWTPGEDIVPEAETPTEALTPEEPEDGPAWVIRSEPGQG